MARWLCFFADLMCCCLGEILEFNREVCMCRDLLLFLTNIPVIPVLTSPCLIVKLFLIVLLVCNTKLVFCQPAYVTMGEMVHWGCLAYGLGGIIGVSHTFYVCFKRVVFSLDQSLLCVCNVQCSIVFWAVSVRSY